MMFPKLRILAAVRRELAPTLDRLGLKAMISDLDHSHIVFVSADRTTCSPVSLVMRKQHEPEDAHSSLKGCHLRCVDFEKLAFQDSDWIFSKQWGVDQIYLQGDDAKSFAMLKSELDALGTAFTELHPRVSFDEDFYKIHSKVGRLLALDNCEPIVCRKSEDTESQHFVDFGGRSWAIVFNLKITISIDDEPVFQTSCLEADKIVPFVKRQFRQIAPTSRNVAGEPTKPEPLRRR